MVAWVWVVAVSLTQLVSPARRYCGIHLVPSIVQLRLAELDQLGGEDSLASRLERMEGLLAAIRARVEGGSGPSGEA